MGTGAESLVQHLVRKFLNDANASERVQKIEVHDSLAQRILDEDADRYVVLTALDPTHMTDHRIMYVPCMHLLPNLERLHVARLLLHA